MNPNNKFFLDIGGSKGYTKASEWKVMDIDKLVDYPHDLNSNIPFPFADDTIDAIYCSHTLEHVEMQYLMNVFVECNRVLKPGGIIRIVVPDFSIGINWYIKNDQRLFAKGTPYDPPGHPPYYPLTRIGRLISWAMTPDNGHKSVFDKETMEYYLKSSWFINIRFLSHTVCSAVFHGKDKERYKDYSLYAEANK